MISDHISYEPVYEKIINNIITDKATIKTFPQKSTSFPKQHAIDVTQLLAGQDEKSNFILPPLSILTQQDKLESVVKIIHQIKCSSKTKQLFVWATAKNIQDKKVIPFIEYLADIVVTLKDKKTLTILIKRNSGSVTKKVRIVFVFTVDFLSHGYDMLNFTHSFRDINTKWIKLTK